MHLILRGGGCQFVFLDRLFIFGMGSAGTFIFHVVNMVNNSPNSTVIESSNMRWN